MIKTFSLRKLRVRSPFFFNPASSLSSNNSFQAQLWHIWLAHSMHCCLLLWGKGKWISCSGSPPAFDQKAHQESILGLLFHKQLLQKQLLSMCIGKQNKSYARKPLPPDAALNPDSKQFCNCQERGIGMRGLQTEREVRIHSEGRELGNHPPNHCLFCHPK